jgi:hypothetical protein
VVKLTKNGQTPFSAERHSDWLKAPSVSGKPRKDSQIRNFSDKTNAYRERWDLLGLNVG